MRLMFTIKKGMEKDMRSYMRPLVKSYNMKNEEYFLENYKTDGKINRQLIHIIHL